MMVDGLAVPPALLRAVQEGRWVAPPASAALYAVVFEDEVVAPQFLAPDRMRANRRWIDAMPEEYRKYYLGRADPVRPPGDMDPDHALVIGDLGPDQPFCLDYRVTADRPRVIYLSTTADWVTIAPDVETLLDKLGL
jgi:hypothetical protein